MSKDTKIEWCDHTFNPWWGCTKVPGDPACHNCYAEAWAKRTGHTIWGDRKPRRELSESHWRGPLRWNASAEKRGVRERVFCASMADVFEDRQDLRESRDRLRNLIADTPHLDWLLLTKRPENIGLMANIPANVWLGVTAVTQRHYDERIPILLKHPAAVHFVSMEPIMEPIDMMLDLQAKSHPHVEWVIFGGESGPRARLCATAWIEHGVKQCRTAGVAPFVKQLGAKSDLVGLSSIKGGDMSEFPESIRVREFPRRVA